MERFSEAERFLELRGEHRSAPGPERSKLGSELRHFAFWELTAVWPVRKQANCVRGAVSQRVSTYPGIHVAEPCSRSPGGGGGCGESTSYRQASQM